MAKKKMKTGEKFTGPTRHACGAANVTSSAQNRRGVKRPPPSQTPSTSARAETARPRWRQSARARQPAVTCKWKGCYLYGRGRPLTRTPPPETPKVQNQRPAKFVSEKDITSCRKLHYGAYIGNESRTIEFKKGSAAYMKDVFPKDVCKYGCAFLNSGGGSLLVGVCNRGTVCGLHLCHALEDLVSLQVDCIMNTFDPPLLPQNYSLQFLPVIQPKNLHHLKVLCLTFKAPVAFTEPTLFQTNVGEVYIRRDGSVHGPLHAPFILEWCRQMWTGKVRKLEEYLREATSEKWFLVGQVQTLVQYIDPMQKAFANLLLQQSAAHADLQSPSGQNSPTDSSLCSYRSSQNQSPHPRPDPPPEPTQM